VSAITGTNSAADVRAPAEGRAADVLTPEALAFVAALQREFGPERRCLLDARIERQAELDAGALPDFLAATREVRDTAAYTTPPSTVTLELMLPPAGTWAFQTSSPVSALRANTHPLFDPT